LEDHSGRNDRMVVQVHRIGYFHRRCIHKKEDIVHQLVEEAVVVLVHHIQVAQRVGSVKVYLHYLEAS